MAIQKGVQQEVKPFKFGKLIPEESEFEQGKVVDYELKSLKDAGAFKNNITAETIRADREMESGSSFSIMPVIKEHRGLLSQEEEDYEVRVANEVAARLEILSKEAHQKGFEAGRETGYTDAHAEAIAKFDVHVNELGVILEEVNAQTSSIYDKSKDEAYKMIRNLTKWIVLKEVNDDDGYIVRLLEKLILEINTKTNLLIKVNQKSFIGMEDVIEKIENKLGAFTNVRVEIDQDMKSRGIILESENGIIDASLKAQFVNIDRLFEAVGILRTEELDETEAFDE